MGHLNFHFLKFVLYYLWLKLKSVGKRLFAILRFRLFAFHVNLFMKIFNHI